MSAPEQLSSILIDLLDPWFSSISNPRESQNETLSALLKGYRATDYGLIHGADSAATIEEFRSLFPITNYDLLIPELSKVRAGKWSAILPEPVSKWVMTRGSTGQPKLIPTTETFLSQIFSCGARALTNFALKRDLSVLQSRVLNLNFPSQVFSIRSDNGQDEKYGYSSGTYAKLFPALDEVGLIPLQEEIDSLGGGVAKRDWERRFDLVFERSKDSNVGCVMGVTPVILAFAKYVKREYGVFPMEKWKMKALFLTSVAKIHSRYAPILRNYYGRAPVVEMYTATEGVFGQQIDDLPYFVPNYDTYFFEVRKRDGSVKLLCDLKRNEWGSLIVSSVLFPRYEIGDMIESLGGGYFRVFGRNNILTTLEHLLYNFLIWNI